MDVKKILAKIISETNEDGFVLREQITSKQWSTILGKKHYQVHDNEEVLAVLDVTIFKNIGDGIIFTNKSIYFAEGDNKLSYEYRNIEEITLKERLLVTDFIINGVPFSLSAILKSQVEVVIRIINEIKNSELTPYHIEPDKAFKAQKDLYEYNHPEGKHHCTTCHAEGKIEKTYSRGSWLLALLFLCAGGVPAFFYVFFYMKNWKACSECKSENLVELQKWRERNPKEINEGKGNEVA